MERLARVLAVKPISCLLMTSESTVMVSIAQHKVYIILPCILCYSSGIVDLVSFRDVTSIPRVNLRDQPRITNHLNDHIKHTNGYERLHDFVH